VPVEWGTRLCRLPQYCQVGHGISGHLSSNQAVPGVPYERVKRLSQAGLVYRDRRGPTVAAAGDHTPPSRGQTRLLCWLVRFHRVTHCSAQRGPGNPFNVSLQKALARECVMFAELRVFAPVVSRCTAHVLNIFAKYDPTSVAHSWW